MAVIYLRLSKRHNELNRNEIIMTFRQGSTIYQRAGTGIFILDKPSYWDGDKMVLRARSMTEEVKYHREMKHKLEDLCSAVNRAWEETDTSRISSTWLKDVIAQFNAPAVEDDEFMGEPDRETVTSTFPQFVASRRVSMYREKHFWTMWRMLRRYELLQGTVFEFETFSHKDLEGFRTFLINEHEYWVRDKETKKMKCTNRRYLLAFDQVNEECQKLGRKIESRCPEPRSKNTLNNILLILKSYWLWCMKEGYADRNPFHKFTIDNAEYGTPFYISQEERLQLEAAPLEGMVALQRDIFVFQSYVGCRVGDLYKFTYDNIVDGCLKYTPRKTKDNNPVLVEVPLVSKAQKLIEKYYDPQRGTLFPFISQQKYNVYIKKAFQEAGLNRKVAVLNPQTRQYEMKPLYEVATSHMARRTFTGIAYGLVQDPNIIASMTGHVEGSKAFNRYRKIDMDVKRSLMDQLDK